MEPENLASPPPDTGYGPSANPNPNPSVRVEVSVPSEPSTTTDYWAGFRAGASFVAGQMGQALNAAWAASADIAQRVAGGAAPARASAVVTPSVDASPPPGDDLIVELDASSSDAGPTASESSEGSDQMPVQDDDWLQTAMHAVLGVPPGELSAANALANFCRSHLGGATPTQCQDRLFALAERWRLAQTEHEQQAGAQLIAWIRAHGERRPTFQAAWKAAELQCFVQSVEAQWQNMGETSLATPQAVVSNLLQAGYSENDLFELLGLVIGGLERRAQDGDEGEDGIGAAQWWAMLGQLVQQRLQVAQQTTVGFIPEAVQHTVEQLSSMARESARQPRTRPWRFAIGVPLTVLVQKPVCIFLGRCIARQGIESLFDVLREAGYSNREIAAVFGVLSTGTLAAGYVYLLLYRSRYPLPQQFRHWRFSTVVMQAGQLSAILLAALGPAVASAWVPDVQGKTLRWAGTAAYTATQAYMTIVSKFVRQAFQSGSSGPVFPLLQLNGVPKAMKLRQQVFRDAAGILGAALVTALSVWCPIPVDGRTVVTRVITEDFYLMLTDWFSDDLTELASVLLMRWFPGELDPATLSISPKDVPNPFGLSAAQVRDGLLEVLDNGCSRVFNGLGDTLSFAAKSLELADQPGAALFVKWLNLLVKAPLSTRRSTLLTVLRTGVGDPRGVQSRALSLLASMVAGHPVEVDGVPVPEWRDLAPSEMAELSLLRFQTDTGRFDPAPLASGFAVRQLTLPEGHGRYRFFEVAGQERRVRPYFHQVAEVRGDGHTACLAAFNMVTMELLGRQSPDAEQAHGWLLDTVLDEGGHPLPVQKLCWAQVLAHFHRAHPRAARLRLQRLHWNALGSIQLDDEEDARRIKAVLSALRVFGLAMRCEPQGVDVHVLVIRVNEQYCFFSPHSARPMWVTPAVHRMKPLAAILAWRHLMVASRTPEAQGGGLIELDEPPEDLLTQEIEILSLAQDGELS